MTSDQEITIGYDDRRGTYSFGLPGVEETLAAITGEVDRGAWAHAVGEAHAAGKPVTVGALAAAITAADQRLRTVTAKKGVRLVKCDCGHECDSRLVMAASRGSTCPDCYDRMS